MRPLSKLAIACALDYAVSRRRMCRDDEWATGVIIHCGPSIADVAEYVCASFNRIGPDLPENFKAGGLSFTFQVSDSSPKSKRWRLEIVFPVSEKAQNGDVRLKEPRRK